MTACLCPSFLMYGRPPLPLSGCERVAIRPRIGETANGAFQPQSLRLTRRSITPYKRQRDWKKPYLIVQQELDPLVEGHCDDRGSEEYNIALGASRAESVKRALVQEGIPADRVRTVSFGKEKPFCTQDNEQCCSRTELTTSYSTASQL